MNARLLLYGGLFAMLIVAWAGAWLIFRAAEAGEQLAPIEPRRFDDVTVVTVGTGNEIENPTRLGPGTLVALGDTLYLVDAGRGIAEALRKSRIPVSQPDTVLLTSLLPENTVGLDDLLLTGWLAPREGPIRLVGPAGTRALAESLLRAHAAGRSARENGLGLPSAGGSIEAWDVDEGWTEERGGLRVTAGTIEGGPVPALGWRFETVGDRVRSVVVSSSGWAPEALTRLATDADMWLHEAVYVPPPEDVENWGLLVDPERLRRDAALHTSIEDIGALAASARVGHLVLTRMRPPPIYAFQIAPVVGEQFDGPVSVASDGDEFHP